MYSAILFDFDGTLTPSLDLWMQAYRYALAGCKVELADELIFERCFYRNYADVAADLGIPVEMQFGRKMEEGLALAFATPKLYPMVGELLESCKQAGLATAIVTTSSRKQVTGALDRLGIAAYFDTVVSANDVKNFKPHPEPVELALARLDKTPEETLFVGDYLVDIQAGRAAGTYTGLFMPEQHAGFYDFEELRATEPDFIFSHHAELIEHLQQASASPVRR
jgi:pyrophosphatase PpaX